LSIATGTAIGTGEANTDLITGTPGCDTPDKAPAPWATKNYTGGSLTDWFLPSKNGWNQVCRYVSNQPFDAAASTCSGAGAPVAGFVADAYWSSPQFGASDAWGQSVDSNYQAADGKGTTYRVRPIRAF
jgi:hypothetical protein